MAVSYSRKDLIAAHESGRSRAEVKAAATVRRVQARYDKLVEQADELKAETMRGAAVVGASFASGWARGRYGDQRMTVAGMPVEALVGVGGHIAALAMRSGSGSAKAYAPVMHAVANGALAAWVTQEGRQMGAERRTSAPVTAGYYPALAAPAPSYALPAPALAGAAPAYPMPAAAGATPAADQALAEAIEVMNQSMHEAA